jgi:hypothetical protein
VHWELRNCFGRGNTVVTERLDLWKFHDDPANTGWGPNFFLGTTTGTDSVVRDNMARFVVNVNGLVTNAGTAPAGMVYGRLFETTTYWKPTDNADGVGSRWFYNSVFATANVGDALTPSKVTFGLYRGGSIAVPAPAVGVELALVKMNWDGTAYTPGDVVATQVFNMPESTTAKTDRIDWTFANPATAPVVALNTDNTGNPGIGGRALHLRPHLIELGLHLDLALARLLSGLRERLLLQLRHRGHLLGRGRCIHRLALHRHVDNALRALGPLQRREGLSVVGAVGRDRVDHDGLRVPAQTLLEQLRELRFAVGHMRRPPAGEGRDHVAERR